MHPWEIVLIVVGAAVVALCIYLIVTLKKLNGTLDSVNALINSNSESLNGIVTNVEAISGDVGSVCLRAKDMASKVGDTVNSYLPEKSDGKSDKIKATSSGSDSIKAAIGVLSALFTCVKIVSKMSEEVKMRKLLKQLKKNKL